MIIEGTIACNYFYKAAIPDASAMRPEHRLLTAILIRAIDDVMEQIECWDYTDAVIRRNKLNAQNWFDSEEKTMFSFAYCCEELGLDRGLFLRKVKKLIKEKTK